jgi:exopolyphosphatase / guanosine-5'-triphosphate,3'-diphosphate pyrophosphatase
VPDNKPPDTIAAVDLGSNSFHMIVAQRDNGELKIVDRLREPVRLAGGLDAKQRLTEEAQSRALACLERFGQRVRSLAPGAVRAVGTNTLRKARNGAGFIARAQAALGHPIEIISGVEEARIIYLGVANSLAGNGGRRLVVDIGGGSTELIVGEGFEPLHLESLYMGCVGMSRLYFPDGRIKKDGMRGAELAAALELQPVEEGFRNLGWNAVTGASGTVRAVRDVVVAAGWSESGITPESLQMLRAAMLDSGDVASLKLKGLADDRRPVFPGGVAILIAVFEALGIERMLVADGALREGLLYDLLGRIRHEDVRERAVDAVAARFHVDTRHGRQVEHTARRLLAQVADVWALQDEGPAQMLAWAARLHEIGLVIAHSQYHKHGAYLLANSDLPGFSRRDQALLAALVRGHRRKLRLSEFEAVPEWIRQSALRLCVLLRLAVLLHRGRSQLRLPPVTLTVTKSGLHLHFPDGWLDEHPLTRADLELEAGYLKASRFKLRFQ